MRTMTMSEMENYLRKGKDNFIKILGNRPMEFMDFVDNLKEADKNLSNFPQDKLWTERGQQIVEKFNSFLAISILILCNDYFFKQGNLIPLTKETVEFLYNNYDKERAFSIYDSSRMEFEMRQKKGQKDTPTQAENEQSVKQVYDNDNYTELE